MPWETPDSKECAKRMLIDQSFWSFFFFDRSSPSTFTFDSEKHWLLVVDDSSNYAWSFFLKEKSDLVDVILSMYSAQRTLVSSLNPWGIPMNTWKVYVVISKRSISGFILYALDVLVSWQLKSQKSMSFSSSEADYTTLSKAVKEVMFVIQLLVSMNLVKYPVTL